MTVQSLCGNIIQYVTFLLLDVRHSGAGVSASESSETGHEEGEAHKKDQIMHRADNRSLGCRRCGVGVVTEQM